MTEEHRETASVGYVFVDDTGQEHGPFEAEVLQAMAQCGEFHANNYVRHSHEQEWHLASDLAWLGFASSAEASTETAVNQSPSNGRLSPAAIVGIVIGVVILIIIIATSGGGGGSGPQAIVSKMKSSVTQIHAAATNEDADEFLDGFESFVEGLEALATPEMKREIENMPEQAQKELRQELGPAMMSIMLVGEMVETPAFERQMMDPERLSRLFSLLNRLQSAQGKDQMF